MYKSIRVYIAFAIGFAFELRLPFLTPFQFWVTLPAQCIVKQKLCHYRLQINGPLTSLWSYHSQNNSTGSVFNVICLAVVFSLPERKLFQFHLLIWNWKR